LEIAGKTAGRLKIIPDKAREKLREQYQQNRRAARFFSRE
jgi:hypothetical protein